MRKGPFTLHTSTDVDVRSLSSSSSVIYSAPITARP